MQAHVHHDMSDARARGPLSVEDLRFHVAVNKDGGDDDDDDDDGVGGGGDNGQIVPGYLTVRELFSETFPPRMPPVVLCARPRSCEE